MQNKLILACVVTQTHFKEFLLLKFSAELFNECEWFIACDEFSYEKLKNMKECQCFKYDIHSGEVFGNAQSSADFLGVVQKKFTIAREALSQHKYVLLLDSDIVFTNPVDGRFWELVDSDIDLAASPHFQLNKMMDDDWGRYNVGFNLLKSPKFIDDWEALTAQKIYKFEQVPMAKLLETGNYRYEEIPINYNMGWWRFNNQHTQSRSLSFYFKDGCLRFEGLPVVCFHFHTFIQDGHSAPLANFILQSIAQSKVYKPLIEQYNRLKEETV